MGNSLTLLLLGTPELAVGGTPVGIRSAKSRALLCYLASVPGPRPRAELAGLLWGERPDANARGSLRLALSELRREVGDWLDIHRDQVRFLAEDACFVDYRQLSREPTVEGALRLWRGEFLDGVSFCDAPAFSCWLEAERRRVRLLLREALLRAGDHGSEQVTRLARLVAELDPYDEEAHRLLIARLAGDGNRAAALACYEGLRRRLREELGVEPAPETAALRRRLAAPPRGSHVAAPPVPGTELIGREADVRRVRALLARERLVTLLGPGGVGKTRLALAVPTPSDEVVFVSFVGVRGEAAVTTLARRLGVDLSAPRPAAELVLAALAGRRALLVLDNLEHLPAFDPFIARVLRHAPGVRVLATTRRRLAVPGQCPVPVGELPDPAAEELFAARAVRAQPAFDAVAEAAHVAAIRAATGGLPLAIELAAGLLRAVPCADLARRLGADPGLLAAAGPAVRLRHAGMRAVFDTSWELLDEAGREALAALSVFGGGCTLDAALEVARTTPEVLVRLVDHSMIQLTPTGRYAVHPLIQQLAGLRLSPERREQARDRHAAHFARLLDRHATALRDGADREAVRVLAPELDNLRLAWPVSRGPRFLDHYWTLCLRLRLYEESAAVVHDHLARTPEAAASLRARWLWMAALSEHQLAREREAIRLARAALDVLGERLPTSPVSVAAALSAAALRQAAHALAGRETVGRETGEGGGGEAAQALTLLARFAFLQQDLPTMLVASMRQLNAAVRAADTALRAEAYANFATIARIARLRRLAGRYGALADRALAAVRRPTEAASRARLARGLDQLHAGAFEEARRSFTEGRDRTLDPRTAENCAGLLAETALWRGDFAAAAELYAATEELAVRRVGGDDIGRHWCLTGRAEALIRLGGVPPEEIAALLAAARASAERRRTHGEAFGLHDSAAARAMQRLRLITATARLGLRPARETLEEALTLAARLPATQPGMLECWTGLAELLWTPPPTRADPPVVRADHTDPALVRLDPAVTRADHTDPALVRLDPAGARADRAIARGLHRHLARYLARNPGAAARVGWADALVLAVAGRGRAARRAADRAVAAADRLAVAYDHRRATEVAHLVRLGRPAAQQARPPSPPSPARPAP
ncbi:Putative HTH-type transcriptional regulator [Nonomuraea coxensis DSM 45129]|uniref:HTH-type transcriptional regulator n=1 Tax=Nonomuraea coxensis DSM 45129 TaxID=1122611 RepID=A0ABX8UCW9_9ACTN|nr:BTAD domain-containing putative transcriptional regulator [Nonomuraea coxensis]QYC45632.1 Putative HTH-type transcriptional regulator [Nonomuraea coxensis DSM 45129]